MMEEKKTGNLVLCGSSYYEQKYFFNAEKFGKLPRNVQRELQILCVLYTEDVGGVLVLEFAPDGELLFRTESEEEDLLYDEIGSVLKLKRLQEEKKELFEALELFYRAMILGFGGVGDDFGN